MAAEDILRLYPVYPVALSLIMSVLLGLGSPVTARVRATCDKHGVDERRREFIVSIVSGALVTEALVISLFGGIATAAALVVQASQER